MEMYQPYSETKNLYGQFSENFELQFYKAFRSLKILGCDYFYFLGTDSNNRYRICSHDDWMNCYHDEKIILNDPLRRLAEKSDYILFPWSQITYLDSKEKRSMEGRIDFGFLNGLTFSKKCNNSKYIFALATESKEHDLARYLLLEKTNNLEIFFQVCIKLFNQYQLLLNEPVPQLM